MAQSHLSDSQRERIVLAYTSGQTGEEAGRAFHVTGNDVRYVLKKKGITRRAHGVRGLTVVSLSEVDKAYIAGIVDGEGGIDVRFNGKSSDCMEYLQATDRLAYRNYWCWPFII